MESAPLDFFQRLLETPGPSGYEQPVQQVVRDYAAPWADQIETDLHGNVILSLNPAGKRRIMLAGHCDQIGMLVTYIDADGFVYAQTIGGWDPQQLIGQRMTVWSAGGPVPAVISRKAIHLQSEEERKQAVKDKDLWLDIGARDKADAEALIQIGDPVTLRLGMQPLRHGLITAPATDNRAGLWVCVEALRRCRGKSVACALYAVSTVQEEIGLRGVRTAAFAIDPHVGIAVDVTHATDCPTVEKKQQGDIRLGQGPVIFRGPNMNPVVTTRLIETARAHQLPHQLSAIGRATSNDANTLQVSRQGVATGLLSIPNRYMHSAVETISLDDIDHAADLLAHFMSELDGSEDFTP